MFAYTAADAVAKKLFACEASRRPGIGATTWNVALAGPAGVRWLLVLASLPRVFTAAHGLAASHLTISCDHQVNAAGRREGSRLETFEASIEAAHSSRQTVMREHPFLPGAVSLPCSALMSESLVRVC